MGLTHYISKGILMRPIKEKTSFLSLGGFQVTFYLARIFGTNFKIRKKSLFRGSNQKTDWYEDRVLLEIN